MSKDTAEELLGQMLDHIESATEYKAPWLTLELDVGDCQTVVAEFKSLKRLVRRLQTGETIESDLLPLDQPLKYDLKMLEVTSPLASPSVTTSVTSWSPQTGSAVPSVTRDGLYRRNHEDRHRQVV